MGSLTASTAQLHVLGHRDAGQRRLDHIIEVDLPPHGWPETAEIEQAADDPLWPRHLASGDLERFSHREFWLFQNQVEKAGGITDRARRVAQIVPHPAGQLA